MQKDKTAKNISLKNWNFHSDEKIDPHRKFFMVYFDMRASRIPIRFVF
ncbi:MAG: hypothetical protein AB7S37_02050 [Methanobacteriales archaeon]